MKQCYQMISQNNRCLMTIKQQDLLFILKINLRQVKVQFQNQL